MQHATAVRLARQHARTVQMLGVDFVPIGKVSLAPGEGRQRQAMPETPGGGCDAGTPDAGATVRASATPRDPAAAAAALEALRERYEREAPHNAFVTAHTRIVFGEGDPCARLMFIGEAPGADEDRTGQPFVGRAGKLLTEMILAMGLTREAVYITNVLKTRPPNNATPTMEEARLCAPYLVEQIRIIAPEIIVTLGLPATRLILNSSDAMGRLRGRWGVFRTPDGHEASVMPTYHPAYLLRAYTSENRRKVWSDLQLVMERLGLAAAP